jgi:hypothetical protein
MTRPELLGQERSLHNDVLFSLLMICQLVIDVAGGLSIQQGTSKKFIVIYYKGVMIDAYGIRSWRQGQIEESP